ARLRRSRPAEPTCAATPRQFRDPGRSLSWVCRSHARDERPRHETQVGMVDAFAACLNLLDGHLSDTSLLCPPNRVKLKADPVGNHALRFVKAFKSVVPHTLFFEAAKESFHNGVPLGRPIWGVRKFDPQPIDLVDKRPGAKL